MNLNDITSKQFKDITYDELFYLYKTLNYGYDHIAKLFNLQSNTSVRKKVKKFNIQKTEDERINCIKQSKQENPVIKKSAEDIAKHRKEYLQKKKMLRDIEKYGSTNLTYKEKFNITIKNNNTVWKPRDKFSPEKQQEVLEKMKRTCLEKYGVDSYMKTDAGKSLALKNLHTTNVANKRKETCLQKYGSEYPFSNNDIQTKVKETVREKYNVDNVSQVSSVREKIMHSRIKYMNIVYNRDENNSNILHSKESLEKFITENSNPTINALAKALQYDACTVDKFINKYNLRDYINWNPGYSSYETDIINWLHSINITNIERNNRTVLDGKEIDIYLPDYKIGIEFNGLYWHSELKKEQTYHQKKSLLAESKGIFIYNIFEHEWLNNDIKEKILNQLKNLLHKNNNIIYARKCTIKEISAIDKKIFIDKYHIQGDTGSKYNIGLEYNNELVAIMTFGTSRFNKECKYELIRYCTKADTNILGGASKLFKYFTEKYMHNGEKCVSYSDISKTKGNIYEILGFTKIKIEYPNYIWTNSHNILTRYQCQMKDEIKTMTEKGYYRIFDSGTKVWIYKKGEAHE